MPEETTALQPGRSPKRRPVTHSTVYLALRLLNASQRTILLYLDLRYFELLHLMHPVCTSVAIQPNHNFQHCDTGTHLKLNAYLSLRRPILPKQN